jgi:WD40 repeat protein
LSAQRSWFKANNDNTLRVWDLKDGKEILMFTLDGKVTACVAAQDNRTIVAGDGFGRLHFLRLVEADETKPSPAEVKIPLLLHEQRSIDKSEKPTTRGWTGDNEVSIVCSL